MSFFERLLGGHHRSGDHHGNKHHQKAPATWNDAGGPGAIICPNCRAQNSTQARFCQQCGSGLGPPACNACGAQMASGARFCSSCGKSA